MPFTSCLRYPRKDSFVQIHEWQLFATGGDKAAAALMSVFEHKHNSIIDDREFDAEIRKAAIAAGLTPPPDFKFWFFYTDDELVRRVKIARKEAVFKSIDLLKAKGFIETDPPVELKDLMKAGRRKWFRFRADRIQPLIDEFDFKLWGRRPEPNDTNGGGLPSASEPPTDKPSRKSKAEKETETFGDLTEKHGATMSGQAMALFDDWRNVHESPQSIADTKRLNLAIKLLKLGVPSERLYLAIRGILLIPHNTGQNESGKFYNDFELIFRDASHFERYERAAYDAGLTTENFRDFAITKSDLRLRRVEDVQRDRLKKERQDQKSPAGSATDDVYQTAADIIADGVAVLMSNDAILNRVASELTADDTFEAHKLIAACLSAAETRAPIDNAIKKKIRSIVDDIIAFQKGI